MERTLGSADNCSISEEFGQAFPLQDGMVFLIANRANIFQKDKIRQGEHIFLCENQNYKIQFLSVEIY